MTTSSNVEDIYHQINTSASKTVLQQLFIPITCCYLSFTC